MGALYDALPINYQRFVDEWIHSCSYTRAAAAAGSQAKNLSQAGRDLLKHPELVAAIQEKQEELASDLEISPERVLKELARIGFSDARKLIGEDGQLLPTSEWDDDTSMAVSSVGIGKDGVVRVKLWSKDSALDKLAKHLGLFERDNEQRRSSLADILREIDGTSMKVK